MRDQLRTNRGNGHWSVSRQTTTWNMQAGKNDDGQSGVQSVSTLDKLERSDVDGWPFRRAKDAFDSIISKRTPRSGVELDAERYNMHHERRGVALIFNHINFKDMTPRLGSEKDSKDLESTLKELGFEVRVYIDPTVKTVTTALQSAAAEDHTDADCLIVAAMSHGESGLLHSTDSLYPVESLWTPFTGDRCTTLLGKPKLFFIQACRGARLDGGAKIIHETDSTSAGYRIPIHADIMVAYSTYDGFYSWRNVSQGSWFIQAICEELNLNGRSRDLLTLMTFVNRRVATEYQSYVPHDSNLHGKKQIPSIVSMLTRLVYFSEKGTLIPDDTDQPDGKKETGTNV